MHTPQAASRSEVIAFPSLHQQFILGAEEQEETESLETSSVVVIRNEDVETKVVTHWKNTI